MRKREGSTGYGYETRGGDKVTAFRDMFDGGGAGRSGKEFEGGGLFSLLANLFASPYGSNRERAAGIIEGPTRPPRTRPSGPPGTTAQQVPPNYTPPGTPVQRGAFQNYGPPGTPVQRGAFQNYGTSGTRPSGPPGTSAQQVPPNYTPPGTPAQRGAFLKYGTPVLTAAEEVMGGEMTLANNYVPYYGPPGTASETLMGGEMTAENDAMALLEGLLTPAERVALRVLPMDQRMGAIQRLLDERVGYP